MYITYVLFLGELNDENLNLTLNFQEKSVQIVMIPSYRSRATQTVRINVINLATSPIKVFSRTRSTSPLKGKLVKRDEKSLYEILLNSLHSVQQHSSPSLNSGKLQNTSDSSLNDEAKNRSSKIL